MQSVTSQLSTHIQGRGVNVKKHTQRARTQMISPEIGIGLRLRAREP